MEGSGPVPEISVVIPARNASETLSECLSELDSQTFPEERFEVIVVDDGSTDNTGEVARAHRVRLIEISPSGPAAARNAGAREARGELLVFTDADCIPQRDFLEQISAAFEEPELAGAKGAYRSEQAGLVPRFVQLEYQHKYERMARFDRIDFIDTYAAAYRRDIFLQQGGFDARFPHSSVEDQEFGFRLARVGYLLRFVPAAKVLHRHNETWLQYLNRKFRIGYWKSSLLRVHPERVAFDTHTPLAQRLQVAIAPLTLLTALLIPLWGAMRWPAILGALIFLGSSMPELWSILRNDAPVAIIAPFMMATRALALAVGLGVGMLKPGTPRETDPWKPLSMSQRLAKRGLDLLLSGLGLILALPPLAVAAVAIKLDSPGPILFTQERVGEGGRRFRMLKLRTMVQDAEARLAEVLARNPLSGPAFKIPDDPRVTRVGRFLRRWSLDELPQLWNVLRGEMSLVGPRPEETAVVAQYNARQRRRLSVPPGLTGPMQVEGRGALDLDERVRLELAYIEHYSLRRDISILLRTLPAVIKGRGAI